LLRQQIGFAEVPLEQAAPYAAEDADITLALHHVLAPKLAEHQLLVDLYENIELPVLKGAVKHIRLQHGILFNTL
jgi:DNA polymerase-1